MIRVAEFICDTKEKPFTVTELTFRLNNFLSELELSKKNFVDIKYSTTADNTDDTYYRSALVIYNDEE